MTTVAVCAIFKDEGPNLTEWVAYHLAVGVDHFFLYDNESTDEGASILLAGPLKDFITVVPIPSKPSPAQQLAYRNFIDFHASNWDWAAFIDLDEFIHPVEADSIKDLLPRYEPYSAVLLHWLVFGPSGHESRPNGLVIENYVRRLHEKHPLNQHVKSLCRTRDLIGELGVHVFDTKGPICNARGEPAPRVAIQDNVCHDVMCINHYYIKSREEWDAKLRRGLADRPESRADPHYTIFSEYARLATVPDERITRFYDMVISMQGGDTDLNDAVYVTLARHLPEKRKDILLTPAPTLPEDFDSARYLVLHPDVAAAGIDGRAHYLKHGFYEGRRWK